MKKLTPIEGNPLKADGGAMFGHVPKALWQKQFEADDENCIALNCRSMLIEENDKTILFEAGSGLFFPPAIRDRYGIGHYNLLIDNLAKAGVSPEDIDIIVLSHLHFDHIGGLVTPFNEGEEFQLQFPNAQYIASKKNWERANNPHVRDRASFVPMINRLLEDSGRLELVDNESSAALGDDYHFRYSDGHTPGLLMTEVKMPEGSIIYVSDLIPASPWLHLPFAMGYDRSAELVSDEKEKLLNEIVDSETQLFFVHDPNIVMSKVIRDGKGRFSVDV